MLVILDITPESRALVARHSSLADRLPAVLYDGLVAAGSAMANRVGELLASQQLPLKSRRGGMGLAGNVFSWAGPDSQTIYVGVPANVPGSAYAGVQQRGGTIRPRTARALAIPLNRRAERYTSPRDVKGLELIPRKGKPPLLVRMLGGKGQHQRMEPWYVLVKSVTLRATRWFTLGVQQAAPVGAEALGRHLDGELRAANG